MKLGNVDVQSVGMVYNIYKTADLERKDRDGRTEKR